MDRANRRAQAVLNDLGNEIREARTGRGLSQAFVGDAVGLSRNQIGLIEHGEAPRVSLRDLARLLAGVGLELSARAYPAGPPIRDAAQQALVDRLRARLHASARWSSEVALPIEGDLRAWDAVVIVDAVRVAVEAETRLRDVQATRRRLNLKLRDDPRIGRLVLLLADTRTNRAAVRDLTLGLGPEFPVPARVALRCLAAERAPPANAIILL